MQRALDDFNVEFQKMQKRLLKQQRDIELKSRRDRIVELTPNLPVGLGYCRTNKRIRRICLACDPNEKTPVKSEDFQIYDDKYDYIDAGVDDTTIFCTNGLHRRAYQSVELPIVGEGVQLRYTGTGIAYGKIRHLTREQFDNNDFNVSKNAGIADILHGKTRNQLNKMIKENKAKIPADVCVRCVRAPKTSSGEFCRACTVDAKSETKRFSAQKKRKDDVKQCSFSETCTRRVYGRNVYCVDCKVASRQNVQANNYKRAKKC